ncbi:MAG: DUF2007 domain-containing protein [Solirubrobacterales bacterium]
MKVAWASNQSEAEMIEGILNAEGIPCLIRRARGFDVPDFLAAGPREILVPALAEDKAREILAALEAGGSSFSPGVPSGEEPLDPRFEAPDFPD